MSEITFSILKDNDSITERRELRETNLRRKDVESNFCNSEFKMISRHSFGISLIKSHWIYRTGILCKSLAAEAVSVTHSKLIQVDKLAKDLY